MAKSYFQIAEVFSEGELLLFEDALREFEPHNLSAGQSRMLCDLKRVITDARRWAHHHGKTDRRG